MAGPQEIFLKVRLSEDDDQIVVLEEVHENSYSQSLEELDEAPSQSNVQQQWGTTPDRYGVKPFQAVTKCCQEMCFRKVTEDEQELLYSHFCQVPKTIQDVYLSGLMRCRSPKTCRVTPIKRRDNIWRYFVLLFGVEVSVCQKFLREVYQVTEKRVRVIQQKTINGEAFGERRGKHKNRPGSIGRAVWDLVREHLSLIPSNKGLDGSTDKRYFTDSTLNVKKLYDMFREFHKERTGRELEKLAYKTYHKFFQTEQQYGFLTQLMITVKSDYLDAIGESSSSQSTSTEKPLLCIETPDSKIIVEDSTETQIFEEEEDKDNSQSASTQNLLCITEAPHSEITLADDIRMPTFEEEEEDNFQSTSPQHFLCITERPHSEITLKDTIKMQTFEDEEEEEDDW